MADHRHGSAATDVLRAVHQEPGIERATVGRDLGLASGFVAETVARLRSLDLVVEQPAPPRGGRGRPTTALHPHPAGPLVLAIAIAHESWRLAVVSVGGSQIEHVQRAHRRDPVEVLQAIQVELRVVRRRYGQRLCAAAVAVPGTVSDDRLIQAPNLGWADLDLGVLWPRTRLRGRPLLVGNDATFAAVAEASRGAARGAGTVLHLYVDAGVGGAVIEAGRILTGAHGMAGEFGHLPFGDPSEQCRCGARGCWNTTLDGLAIARALGRPAPTDDVSYTGRILAAARASLAAGGPPSDALIVVQGVARSLGRGAGGLVNAFDPDIVTLGGIGRDFLEVADVQLQPAYLLGLMQHRATPPPPLVAARFGDDAPIVGAAEEAMNVVLTEAGLARWSEAFATR